MYIYIFEIYSVEICWITAEVLWQNAI